jgi:hypothetical protein
MRDPDLLLAGEYIYLFDRILGVKLVTGTFIAVVVSILSSFCAFMFVPACESSNSNDLMILHAWELIFECYIWCENI